jgi:hypothetical protein
VVARTPKRIADLLLLQLLPPRQLAVLVLRDVLGFPARQVAEMLDTTSALKRARARLQSRAFPDDRHAPHPVARSSAEHALVERFVSTWEAADAEGVVALLTTHTLSDKGS